MNIIIRADRKIGKIVIATYKFKGKKIIDRIINFLLGLGQKELYIISDRDLNIRGVKNISVSELESLKNKGVIDLRFTYDCRKLKKLIAKKKSFNKAIILENRSIGDIKNFGCLYERKEWNPISQFYLEPLGEKIAFWMRNTKITPNSVTFLNIFLSMFASILIFFGGRVNLIFFGLWVRIFHMLDIVDGQLARLKNQGTTFGKWIDGGADRFVVGMWYIVIIITLYFKLNSVFFLFVGLILLFGAYLYNYLLLTSVAYFRNFNFEYKSNSRTKKNPFVKFFLLFINHDIQMHLLTISAWLDMLGWYIIFYGIYFNSMWFMYFIFYFTKYLREGDIKEV